MPPLTILHISDLHFGPPFVPRTAEAALRAAHDLAPDLIIASGDFTQRARPEQFAQARAYLDRLPAVPLVVTPGNHDIPLYHLFERLVRPYALYCKHIAPDLESVTDVPGARIVSLNSTAPRRAITNGRVSREQLAFAAKSLANTPEGTLRIVVAHHHFAPAPDYEKDQTMPKAKRAMDAFVALGVDMIVGGHLHRAYIGNSLDIYPGLERDRGVIIVQAGTTTSRRGRAREAEKNTFNIIRADENVVHVTHCMYFDEDDAFLPMSRHIFPRPGRRGLPPAEAIRALDPVVHTSRTEERQAAS